MNLFYGIGMGLGWSLPRGLLLVDLSVRLSIANIAALVWHGRVLVRAAADESRLRSNEATRAPGDPTCQVRGRDVGRLQELEQRRDRDRPTSARRRTAG